MSTVSAALVAFGTTLCLTPIALVALRHRQVLDVPTHRSSHRHPTPRGGGVAVAIGVTLGASLAGDVGRWRAALIIPPLLFAAIGFADDVRPLPVAVRLPLQVLAASAALVWLLTDLTGGAAWKVLFAAACVLWLVSFVNAFNFMDGINGISVAQAGVAGAAWIVAGALDDVAVLVAAGAVLLAGALAFGPYNFPHARVFLGDVGSYFLGAWVAGGTIVALRLGAPPELCIAPLVLYLADTSTTLIRRRRSGERVTDPHRTHVYQRLTDRGWSHARTTTTIAGLMVVCVAIAAAGSQGPLALRVLASALVLGVAAVYVRLPDLVAPPVRSAT